jgi:hypothetical protein
MALKLKILDGARAGETLEVAPGAPFVIGRAANVSLPLADNFLSGRHSAFEEAEGGRWRVADLGSRNGTFVNGQQTPGAVLSDGDEVRVGGVRLLVESGAGGDKPTAQQRLIRYLRQRPEPIYALVDAARTPDTWALVSKSREPHMSLFEGPKAHELESVAPYLVGLTGNDPTLDSLVYSGWGQGWATYLTSGAGFHDLRNHLRRQLMADTEGGKKVYFRFYDPRVLRTYLAACTPEEVIQFFGPVRLFMMEGEDPEIVLECGLSDGQLARKEVRYAAEPAGDSPAKAGPGGAER